MAISCAARATGGIALLAAVGAALLPSTGTAQAYPSKPVRMIVPFPPGTSSDSLGRIVGLGLSEMYKQPVLADNRPGAGGLIGSTVLARANADGYTLALIGLSHVVPPLLQAKPPYHPVADFAAIAQIASVPSVLVVAPDVPAKNVKELIAFAKANPGKLNFASTGVGSSGHMAPEIFNRAAGIQVVHVPFKAVAEVYAEALQSRVHFFVFTLPAALPLLRDGRLRALAVTTPNRASTLPGVPTLAESGLPEAQSDAWFGVVAPASTPPKLIARLSADIVGILRRPETREQFQRQGAEPTVDTTPAAFAKMLASEYARYQKLVKDIGLAPQ